MFSGTTLGSNSKTQTCHLLGVVRVAYKGPMKKRVS